MKFIYTSEETQAIAIKVASFLEKVNFTISIESALSDNVQYRPTFIAQKGNFKILIETQKVPMCDQGLLDMIHWLQNERCHCELYIAAHESATLTGILLKQLQRNGIGLIVVHDNKEISVFQEPKNPALTVSPDPTLNYGPYRTRVRECLSAFNAPNSFLTKNNRRKEALSDMCDLVEGLTRDLAVLSVKKGFLKLTQNNIDSKDWNGLIDTLASQNAYIIGNPIISNNLKFDLHSFRGARNLLKHPAKPTERIKRQKQFTERMMMGPRLIAELVTIKSSTQRKRKMKS